MARTEISQTGRRLGAVGAAAALLAAGSGLVAPAAGAAATAATVRVGSAPTVPGGSKLIAAPSDNQKLDLSVSLKPRNESALQGFVQAVSTPGSPGYHDYLSKDQFAQMFGPTQATITATENALEADGLTVAGVSPDGLTISVSTTVGQAASAFAVGFSGYRLADGKSVYANTRAPQLPAAVAQNVDGIVGLDNLVTPSSELAPSGHTAAVGTPSTKAKSNAVKPAYTAPTVCSNYTAILNDNGWYDGEEYYSPSALASIYGTTSDLSANDNGSGISVGVFELESIDTTGFSDWDSCLGISTQLSVDKIDGGASTPPDADQNVGVESALDVDTIASLAPGVSIIDYEGPDAVDSTDANVLDVYQRMVTDDTVKVISSSWGLCELDSDAPLLTAENTVFQEAAAQGQTVVAASGDYGSTQCVPDQDANSSLLSVADPASQPNVLGVGGTSMQGLAPSSESAWNSDDRATAGGVSADWPLFGGAYQSGFTGPGYHNACNATAGYTCRQVPDVAALADPNEGYLAVTYSSGVGDEQLGIVGGTSGAAPLWAAILALSDASQACTANGPVGFVNPALYATQAGATAKSGVINDVTTGNNVLVGGSYNGPDYQAGVGYDMTTAVTASGIPLAPATWTLSTPLAPSLPVAPRPVRVSRIRVGVIGTK